MPGLQARTSAAAGANDASRLRWPHGGQMTWTDERVVLLKKHLADGLSFSQIAAQLGGCSRNACIGKAARLGLSQPIKPRQTFARPRRIASLRFVAPRPPSAETELPIALPFNQSPCAVTFIELQHHHCRWPIGDGPFMYCGARHGDESPYCRRHHRIAYVKPERRGLHEKGRAMGQSGMAGGALGQPQRSAVG